MFPNLPQISVGASLLAIHKITTFPKPITNLRRGDLNYVGLRSSPGSGKHELTSRVSH
jgi:hypothetical protein